MSVVKFCHQPKKQIPSCYHATKFFKAVNTETPQIRNILVFNFLFMNKLSSRVKNRQAVQHVLKKKLLQTLAICVENNQYLDRAVTTSGLLRYGAITRLIRKDSPRKVHTTASRHNLGAR